MTRKDDFEAVVEKLNAALVRELPDPWMSSKTTWLSTTHFGHGVASR